MTPSPDLPERVAAVRRFNRFYTRQIGVLQQGLLRSPFSLTEVRVLWELAHRDAPTATELGQDLDLDQGYLSRILRALARRGLLTRRRAESDGRQTLLGLSARGRQTFAGLNARSDEEIGGLLGALPPGSQLRLVEAMETIERLLGSPQPAAAPYVLRPPHPGDLGWIVHRHGALYAQEYGWDERFEGLVAGVVSEFVRRYDPKRERCWIAEREGRIVGSVFLVRQSKQVAKLRLLLVEPEARGLGIGSRLVAECVGLARALGYRKLVLWTNDVLHEARRIYQRAGFRLVEEAPHTSFGEGLVGQTWELDLRESGAHSAD